jgi:hypothetical protein
MGTWNFGRGVYRLVLIYSLNILVVLHNSPVRFHLSLHRFEPSGKVKQVGGVFYGLCGHRQSTLPLCILDNSDFQSFSSSIEAHGSYIHPSASLIGLSTTPPAELLGFPG